MLLLIVAATLEANKAMVASGGVARLVPTRLSKWGMVAPDANVVDAVPLSWASILLTRAGAITSLATVDDVDDTDDTADDDGRGSDTLLTLVGVTLVSVGRANDITDCSAAGLPPRDLASIAAFIRDSRCITF